MSHDKTDTTALYAKEAERLARATKLVPIAIRSSKPLASHASDETGIELAVCPPRHPSRYFAAIGLRLFHSPRFAIIDRISRAGEVVVHGPVDASAYQVEGPVSPLAEPPEGYRGEVLRFVAVDLGVFAETNPIVFHVRAHSPESFSSQVEHFEGYLVGLPIVEPPCFYPWNHV